MIDSFTRYLPSSHNSNQQQQIDVKQRKKEEEKQEIIEQEEIYASATVWMTNKSRPTLYLPALLAQKYKMNRPCRVGFIQKDNGILVRFLHE